MNKLPLVGSVAVAVMLAGAPAFAVDLDPTQGNVRAQDNPATSGQDSSNAENSNNASGGSSSGVTGTNSTDSAGTNNSGAMDPTTDEESLKSRHE